MHSPIKVNLKTAEGKPTSTTINFVLAYGLLIAQNKGKISTLDITRELVAKNLQAFIADFNKQENRVFTDKENIEFAILHEIM